MFFFFFLQNYRVRHSTLTQSLFDFPNTPGWIELSVLAAVDSLNHLLTFSASKNVIKYKESGHLC